MPKMPKNSRNDALLAKVRAYKLRRPKKQCLYCGKNISVDHLLSHIRRKHPEINTPPVVKKMPRSTMPHYRFISKMVYSNILSDVRTRSGEKYRKEEIRTIVREIQERLGARLSTGSCYDDCGGYLKNGFAFHPHSIYKLSLDRINNDKVHYYMENGKWTRNIQFVITGINHHTNPSALGKDMCRILRGKMEEKPSVLDIERVRSIYKLCNKKNIAYKSCKTSRTNNKNDKCYEVFKTIKDQWTYGKQLLEKQGMLCAISGILMDPEGKAGNRMFAPSFDAIYPREGHVPGNLRWVCSFLNNTNCDKMKKEDYEDDDPTTWTRERWREYVGMILKNLYLS
jgi:hypothetical protein